MTLEQLFIGAIIVKILISSWHIGLLRQRVKKLEERVKLLD